MNPSNQICRKVKYRSEQDAIFAIDKIKATSKRSRIPQRAYKCPYCHCWHLTSRPNIEDLQAEILSLRNTIDALKQELLQLKGLNEEQLSAQSKQISKELKKDGLIVQYKAQLQKVNDTLSRLRKDQEQLICLNVQLQKRLEKYEPKNT